MTVTRRPCERCRRLTWQTRWSLSDATAQRLATLAGWSLGTSLIALRICRLIELALPFECRLCSKTNDRPRSSTYAISGDKASSNEDGPAPSVDPIEPIATFYRVKFERTFEAGPLHSERVAEPSCVAKPERRKGMSQRDYWAWHDTLYLGGSWRSPEWQARAREAKRRDGGRCRMCGSDQKLQTDHIVPLSKGGSNEFENLQTLCKACHEIKTGRPLRDWNDPDES